MLRPRPGHDRHRGDVEDRVGDLLLGVVVEDLPHHFVARAAGAGEHRLHPLLGGQDDGQAVGQAPLVEQALEFVFGSRSDHGLPLHDSLRRHGHAARVGHALVVGEGVDDLVDDPLAGEGVRTLDVAVEGLAW